MKPLTTATAELLSPLSWSPQCALRLDINAEATKFSAHISSNMLSRVVNFVKRVPERKRLETTAAIARLPGVHQMWEFGATELTAAIIQATWPRTQVFMSPETRDVFDYLILSNARQEICADRNAAFKDRHEVRTHPRLTMVHPELPLSPYQIIGASNALDSDGYALFMDPGTGKTAVTISVACNEAAQLHAAEGRAYRMLVVCPKCVQLNWQREVARFATAPSTVTVLRGGDLDRTRKLIEALAAPPEAQLTVLIVSYETAVRMLSRLSLIPWDLLVADEGHWIKMPGAKRTKAMWSLRDVAAKRMLLTGTPITNTALDLYAQLEFLYRGGSGFITAAAFKEFYGVYNVDEGGRKMLVGVQNMPFMQERLVRTSFMITKEEALPDLPPKTYDVYEAEMSDEQTKRYEDLRDMLITEVEETLADADLPQAVVVQNALTQLLRLAQITSGFINRGEVVDPDTNVVLTPARVEHFNPCPKIDALLERMSEAADDEKGLIWSCFVPSIEAISERLTALKIEHVTYYGQMSQKAKDAAEHRYNYDPSCKWLVGNPEAGGVGLNLLGYPVEDPSIKTDTCHEIYFAQNWKPTPRWQSEDRGHRRNTRRPVRVTDLVVPGTIDEEIRARTTSKRLKALTISDVRDLLNCISKGVLQ